MGEPISYERTKALEEAVENLEADLAGARVEIARLTAERDLYHKALRNVLYQGHDLDCLFCGFKDKVAQQALDGIDPYKAAAAADATRQSEKANDE